MALSGCVAVPPQSPICVLRDSECASAPRDRRASIRHDEGADGRHPLPDENPAEGATEMALSVLAYNLTRVMNIVCIKPLITAIGRSGLRSVVLWPAARPRCLTAALRPQ